jgi:multidrug efflux system outer membrane protein
MAPNELIEHLESVIADDVQYATRRYPALVRRRLLPVVTGSRLQGLDAEAALQAQKIDTVSFAEAIAQARYERGVASRLTAMDARQAVLLERIPMLEVDGQRVSQDIAMPKAPGGGYREQTPVELRAW